MILNNTIDGNTASTVGGGIDVYLVSFPEIRNNIITNSTAGGGVSVDGTSIADIHYNDVWNNTGGNYLGIPDQAGLNDNISQYPMFDVDYGLMSGSPCLDSGDPDSQYDDPDGSRSDMGAYIP